MPQRSAAAGRSFEIFDLHLDVPLLASQPGALENNLPRKILELVAGSLWVSWKKTFGCFGLILLETNPVIDRLEEIIMRRYKIDLSWQTNMGERLVTVYSDIFWRSFRIGVVPHFEVPSSCRHWNTEALSTTHGQQRFRFKWLGKSELHQKLIGSKYLGLCHCLVLYIICRDTIGKFCIWCLTLFCYMHAP